MTALVTKMPTTGLPAIPASSGFSYRGGVLHVDSVALPDIAAQVGTPTYVYSATALEAGYRSYAGAFADRDALVCYALKANSNLAVIGTFAALGSGADVVSGGELARALAAGVPAERIVFAGVGKTPAEMEQGLAAGILQFNIESEPELQMLDAVARRMGKVAEIAVRVNPDVDANTHAKITTGKKGNKFGIDIDRAAGIYRMAAGLPNIRAVAVSMHIGSQLTDLAPYRAAYERMVELVRALRIDGHVIDRLDLGGGIGITYQGEETIRLADYAAMVKSVTDGLGCRLILEPGRRLVGNAGVLLTRVVYVKQGSSTRFLILDSAMNDLVRPAMYDAWHDFAAVAEPAAGAPLEPVDLVGPICESGDTFARGRPMPPLADGDLVAILSAGAYGAVMASSYNTRPPPAEVLVRGDQFSVIKPRRTAADLFADERPPAWAAPLSGERA